MSISRQSLSVLIVTFKSDKVIDRCIQSIPQELEIIIIDNSNNQFFKENIERKYKNVKCYLSPENLGMGNGNNFGLKKINSDYALILNPDVTFEKNSFNELILASEKLKDFGIIAPKSSSQKYPNYKFYENKKKDVVDEINPFKVKSVDGFAMLLNLKRLNKNFKEKRYFDENIFMYLENDDLCKRLIEIKEDIFVVPKSIVHHEGGRAVDIKYSHEIELSRNWHWMWSKFYYNKKHYSFVKAFFNGMPSFISAIIKFLIYFLLNKTKKKQIYLHRILGFYNALSGKKSWFRPNVLN